MFDVLTTLLFIAFLFRANKRDIADHTFIFYVYTTVIMRSSLGGCIKHCILSACLSVVTYLSFTRNWKVIESSYCMAITTNLLFKRTVV